MRLGRSAGLTGYAELARALGVDPYRMAAAEGLPPACLTDPDLKVPSAAIGRLLEATAAKAGAEDFGLRLAESRRLSNLGVVALVAREQPDLRGAIRTLTQYTWLQNEALSFRLEVGEEVSLLRLLVAAPGRGERQAVELSIGVLVRAIRALLSETWRPQGVDFEHAAPTSLAAYRRALGVTPRFGQDQTAVVLLNSDLDAPIAMADPVVARQMERYVEQVAGRRHSDLEALTRELIAVLLPTGSCSVDKVAAHVGVTRRTLHRQLAVSGLTFTGLLEDVRRQVFQARLAVGGKSLTEISELLGYSSLSAFSRWKRRLRDAA